LFGAGIPSHATSTPFNPALHRLTYTPGENGDGTTLQSISRSTGSSGISSIRSDVHSNGPTPTPQSYMPV